MSEAPIDRTVHYYRNTAVVTEYDRRFSGPGGSVLHQLQSRAIAGYLSEAPRITGLALDAGCGTGRFQQLLRDHYSTVVGVDASRRMLLEANRRAESGALIASSLDRLPFAANSFDVALCVWVLNHNPTYLTSIQELCRVANRVIVAVPNSRSAYAFVPLLRSLGIDRLRGSAAGSVKGADGPSRVNVSLPRLRRELDAVGLRITRAETYMFFPVVPDVLAGLIRWLETKLEGTRVPGGSFLLVSIEHR